MGHRPVLFQGSVLAPCPPPPPPCGPCLGRSLPQAPTHGSGLGSVLSWPRRRGAGPGGGGGGAHPPRSDVLASGRRLHPPSPSGPHPPRAGLGWGWVLTAEGLGGGAGGGVGVPHTINKL